jgi:hypothetical protein
MWCTCSRIKDSSPSQCSLRKQTANFKTLIKTLKNRPRVPTQVKLNYSERYLLDDSYFPTQVMCLSLLQIPGTLYRHEKTIVKQLSVS